MKFLIAAILFIGALEQFNCQTTPTEYIVQIVDYTGDTLGTDYTVRCLGTIIKNKDNKHHILTTANCATPPENRKIGVFASSQTTPVLTQSLTVEKITKHPDWKENNNNNNNLAVLKLNDDNQFNGTYFRPQTFGTIKNESTSCTLHTSLTEGVSVTILPPHLCDKATNEYAFCTSYETAADVAAAVCAAHPGSPLTCGNDENIVAGWVVGNTGNPPVCAEKGAKREKYYHSVADYKDWVEEVVNSAMSTNFSVLLVVSAILISLKNMI